MTLYLLVAAWFGLALYWAWRTLIRRNPLSLVIAVGCLGWVFAAGRWLKWFSTEASQLAIAAAVVVGVFGWFAVLHWEINQPKPFR